MGSITAKNGIRAEKQICMQSNVKLALEDHFNKPIKEFQCVSGKKYDIKITFDDKSITTVQNKDGNGGGRGWSIDRRNVSKYDDVELITLLKTVCLKTGKDKPSISKIFGIDAVKKGILGVPTSIIPVVDGGIKINEPEKFSIDDQPNYFTHTVSDKITKEIKSISICKTTALVDFITDGLYVNAVPKRTCVHLSPNIYLQRKGGGKKDSRPDDIQMKLKLTDELSQIFLTLSLKM